MSDSVLEQQSSAGTHKVYNLSYLALYRESLWSLRCLGSSVSKVMKGKKRAFVSRVSSQESKRSENKSKRETKGDRKGTIYVEQDKKASCGHAWPNTKISDVKEEEGRRFRTKSHPQCGDQGDIACQVTSVVSNSLWPYGLQPARLLCLWDFPRKNTGVGCHALPGGGGGHLSDPSNLCLLCCRWILYHWASKEAQLMVTSMLI